MIPVSEFANAVVNRRPRDKQRSKVYRWEVGWVLGWDGPEMTLDECRALVGKVFGAFGKTKLPAIKDGRGTRAARGSRRRISLPRWARRRPTVLHEITHALLPKMPRVDGEYYVLAAHGPEFVRLYIELLARYSGESRGELARLARKEHIEVGAKVLALALARGEYE